MDYSCLQDLDFVIPVHRIAIGVQTRLEADPSFPWKVAAAAGADVLAVLGVNAAAHPGEPLHRSEAVASQVRLVPCNVGRFICQCLGVLAPKSE